MNNERVIPLRLIVVTGLSGSGISTAINALEDIGFFCVDNLPPALLPKLIHLAHSNDEFRRLAIGLDARNIGHIDTTLDVLDGIRAQGVAIEMLYLEASPDVLHRRFDVARRPHPFARYDFDLSESIRRESETMQSFREQANYLIDTSDLNVHECKHMVQRHLSTDGDSGLLITLMSFGFRYGVPNNVNILWDVRFLPNPYFDFDLRPLTGKDQEIQDFVFRQETTVLFYSQLREMILQTIPAYKIEGKRNLTIALGCTGGKHRSVSLVERLSLELKGQGEEIRLRHRDLGQE